MVVAHKASKIGFKVLGGITICVFLTACSDPTPPPPQYKQKALDDKARGITIATSKVYGCKSIGETEGKDVIEGRVSGVTKEKIRESAINDLKNNAIYAVKEGQKIMIKIDKEEMRCKVYPMKDGKVNRRATPKEEDCTNIDPLPSSATIASYKIIGDLYDCGEK